MAVHLTLAPYLGSTFVMLGWRKQNWWLLSGIIVFLIIRAFVEPFKSNLALSMVAAVAIGVLIAVLMGVVSAKGSSQ